MATLGSGGHPPPLLVRAGQPVEPHSGEGPLVGVIDQAEFHDHELALLPGDTLLLYTDGVTEGRRGNDLYDDQRLHTCVEKHVGSAAAMVEAVLEDVLTFQGGNPRDDVAIVAIGVPPAT